MNFEQFRNLIHDIAREDTSNDAAVITALSHAESCHACDALLRESEALTANLRALAAHHNSEAAPAHVESALLHAFRQQHTPRTISISRNVATWIGVSVGALATAAALIFLLIG